EARHPAVVRGLHEPDLRVREAEFGRPDGQEEVDDVRKPVVDEVGDGRGREDGAPGGAAHRAVYRPVQWGLRFSRKARTPSRKSALAYVVAIRSSPPRGRRSAWTRRIASFAAQRVIGAWSAISAASARTRASMSPAGTSSWTEA